MTTAELARASVQLENPRHFAAASVGLGGLHYAAIPPAGAADDRTRSTQTISQMDGMIKNPSCANTTAVPGRAGEYTNQEDAVVRGFIAYQHP